MSERERWGDTDVELRARGKTSTGCVGSTNLPLEMNDMRDLFSVVSWPISIYMV